ncbi:MAG: hypothetical protein RL139_1423 [Gemmatimonadota bacterium]
MITRDFPPLLVVGAIGSRRGDAERGPALWIRPDDAGTRLITEGELVWIYGPRRHELAPVTFADDLPKGGVVVRDIAGVSISEIVRLVKQDVEHRPVLTRALT